MLVDFEDTDHCRKGSFNTIIWNVVFRFSWGFPHLHKEQLCFICRFTRWYIYPKTLTGNKSYKAADGWVFWLNARYRLSSALYTHNKPRTDIAERNSSYPPLQAPIHFIHKLLSFWKRCAFDEHKKSPPAKVSCTAVAGVRICLCQEWSLLNWSTIYRNSKLALGDRLRVWCLHFLSW